MTRMLEFSVNQVKYFCSYWIDETLVVYIARCSNGQLRLTDDPQANQGRIEICSQQRWETFYSVWWSSKNSEVACWELGFRSMQSKYFYV